MQKTHHQQIQHFLQHTCHVPQELLQYEINEETTKALWSLMQICQQRQVQNKCILEDVTVRSKEYEKERQRLTQVWNAVFDKSVPAAANTLAEVATVLEAKDTSQASMMQAYHELQHDMEQAESEHEELLRLSRALGKKVLFISNRLKQLQTMTDAQKQAHQQTPQRIREFNQAIEMMKKKAQEYSKRIEDYKKQLEAAGFDSSIMHQEILSLYKQYQELKTEVESKELKLQAFLDLPADVDLAKLKIAETKQTVKHLEDKVQAIIGKITID